MSYFRWLHTIRIHKINTKQQEKLVRFLNQPVPKQQYWEILILLSLSVYNISIATYNVNETHPRIENKRDTKNTICFSNNTNFTNALSIYAIYL